MNKWAIAIHGGASNHKIDPSRLPSLKMHKLIAKGGELLKNKNSAVDTVTYIIQQMENSGLFNAGIGSTNYEMDACIMDGERKKSGSVISIYNVKNPILVAKKLLTEEQFILSGNGAYDFAKRANLTNNVDKFHLDDIEEGTVGCVCIDSYGDIAAGTSTGGISENHILGRVGDSGIVGAGTYAENKVCGISCTGKGEEIIRNLVAYDITCRMKYGGKELNDAMKEVIENMKSDTCGCIGVDSNYRTYCKFNTKSILWENMNYLD